MIQAKQSLALRRRSFSLSIDVGLRFGITDFQDTTICVEFTYDPSSKGNVA